MAVYVLGTLTLLITVATLWLLFLLSYKKGHQYGLWFLGGFVYNCFTISFFYIFLPVPWIQSLTLQYVGMTLFIVIGALVSGLSFLVIPFILRKGHLFPKILLPLLIFFAFMVHDMFRSIFISIFLYGEGASIGLHFILGSIGESLAFTPLIVFAYGGGVYLLTGLLALVIFITFSSHMRMLPYSVAIIYFLLLTVIFFSLQLRTLPSLSDMRIGILSTDWPNPNKENPLPEFIERVSAIDTLLKKENSTLDLLILPESTGYLDARGLITEKDAFRVENYLDNTTIQSGENYYSTSLFYDKASDLTEIRRKSSLMVFSEYSPHILDILSSFSGGTMTTGHKTYKRSSDYHTFTLKNKTFGALICSEGTSMMPLFSFEKKNPDFYVLQSNLVVMNKNPLGFMHLYAYTRLIAVTSGKTVLGVSNGAPSYGFDGKGRLLYSLKPSLFLAKPFLP
jgi:apolipoprotein N-acyltransferase